ncbi:MAG: hypothetical protein ACR652_13675 [Methylocystis sp.]|uniref:hypothetical protein n=1 Tax=Methylocystis sp. TaxID=1911079 RepID=UPI003DA44D09
MSGAGSPNDDPAGAHALADMFLTLAAMALFAVAASAGSGPRPAGDSGLTILAAAQGVSIGGRDVPLVQLLDDAELRTRIAQARGRGETVRVVITSDGGESAFALESLLGGMLVRQSRLTSGAPALEQDAPP